ncbi:hypothetical protein [Nitrincola sp. MINF-07-Sa-05]|uniref:hypothetical protein n=1 Tax=Nitrincola salilacus TaxID=3400273 RepID=UPI003917C700
MDIKFCRPGGGDFIIVESIHTSDIFRVSELTQVYRQVIGFCNFEEFKFDGEPLSGIPSQIQYIKNFVSGGRRITTHPTGQNGLYYVYRGVRNSGRPIANLNIEGKVAGILSKSYDLGVPMSPFIFGTDPVPEVQLSMRNDIHFIMPGNQPPPTAFAIYNKDTGLLHEVTNLAERRRLISGLSAVGSRF